MDDDVSDGEDELRTAQRSYNRMRGDLLKAGFRDGVGEGQERLLQKGFNNGFKVAAGVSYDIAKLRGVLSAHIGYVLSHHAQDNDTQRSEKRTKLEKLLEHVVELEEEWVRSSIPPSSRHDIVDAVKTAESPPGRGHEEPAAGAGPEPAPGDVTGASEGGAPEGCCGGGGGAGGKCQRDSGDASSRDTAQHCGSSTVVTDAEDVVKHIRQDLTAESVCSNIDRLKRTLSDIIDE